MYYTRLSLKPFENKITYSDALFFIGSCFSESVAEKFKLLKFQVLSNPFGTLYNPVSIANALDRIVAKTYVCEQDFFLKDEIYRSFDFHSSLTDVRLEELILKVNNLIETAHTFLNQAKWVFITLGTSFVFKHKELNKIVANCHKMPASVFEQYLLTEDEVYLYLTSMVQCISSINPTAQLVFTVSPVRYLSGGAFENQVSKALLIISINRLLKENQRLLYFPAYELFMDELRDYRYYDNDLIHPSPLGVEHVWNRLLELAFDEKEKPLMKQIQELVLTSLHKPMFPETSAYKQLKTKMLDKIYELQRQYPFLNFDKEKKMFLNQKE